MVGEILRFFSNDLWSGLANIQSSISFGLLLWGFVNLRKIKRYYVFTGRVPDLLESLRRHASSISLFLNDFEDSISGISEELARAEIVVKSLKKKLNREPKRAMGKLLKTMRAYEKSSTEANLWQAYIGMIKAVDQIEDLQQDMKWEIRT